ncbi:MAG TPA: hypothetical protein DIS62_05810 [Candidatus Kerfeldbacteria bacterium]|nr:hypothetical protein [Candidatus Kerfeldbacteria bacterium]
MNTETQKVIQYVLTSGKPVGRWEAARAAGASQGNARNVFETMRCLVPAGVRLRNGNSEPEKLSRVDLKQIPLCCSECSHRKGNCDPTWRGATVPVDIDMFPPNQEGV